MSMKNFMHLSYDVADTKFEDALRQISVLIAANAMNAASNDWVPDESRRLIARAVVDMNVVDIVVKLTDRCSRIIDRDWDEIMREYKGRDKKK